METRHACHVFNHPVCICEEVRRISQRLDAWCESIAGYFFRRAAIASLRELDARELRDIGLVRSQIEDAVRGFISLPGQGRKS
jgi:uncharacterized protein YjiS (DUF1127 family)